ncbi:WD40 repeat-like protein [Melanomma pulvis-pyrius CBS 109.77]|uniref:WD40 repeat-like protein n=1 Tax=Melanomma pulvis-pyrius CBS 109.77 TaxID=1314802 RepID=A0A6A6X2F4_9PLEO|nr:WD40 repeat-like protein [Melanomma pulvis-pyrius CBS 109.77]
MAHIDNQGSVANLAGHNININNQYISHSNESSQENDQKCIQHLRLTVSDPRDDKKTIEDAKGGLLEDSYCWILEHPDFQQWRNEQQSKLLWIEGGPGKGKTMLLCGIINELHKSIPETALLSYFFCQAANPRSNSATAVVRGLLYLLVKKQPSLVSHIRKKYDDAGKAVFEAANAWAALSEIFTNILQDPSLNTTYLIVDGLDECVTDLPKLLDFVTEQLSTSCPIKWIVSSRSWPNIEERLERAGCKVRLSLELNAESVSTAVGRFIQHKVHRLAEQKKYNNKIRDAVLNYLTLNADNTFLWVALVCKTLNDTSRWNAVDKLNAFPHGLESLYRRMIQQICSLDDADLCKQILASVATVYQPITLKELTSLVKMPDSMADDPVSMREIVDLCGSFLTIRENTIYFVHQSAKDFLFTHAFSNVFPFGREGAHYAIFSRSLQVMSDRLKRDIYSLGALGYPIEQVEQPDPDPLAALRYSCIYWIDHFHDSARKTVSLRDLDAVEVFLRKKYLNWLEALSLCKSMSKGMISMAKLEALVQACFTQTAQSRIPITITNSSSTQRDAAALVELVRDASRFIMYHRAGIENSPLQAYVSALLFSPARSVIRKVFEQEQPDWFIVKPALSDRWSACLQTLDHGGCVESVAFSHNSTWLASASSDCVKIWNTISGTCLRLLEGHTSVVFSHDSARLASASTNYTVKIWDVSSGACLQTLDHGGYVNSVAFSHNSTWLASASSDCVKIWNASGACLRTLHCYSLNISSIAFSHDSTQLASASTSSTVKIWNVSSGKCLRTLEGHTPVAFSHDSTWLASASSDFTVKIWDARGACLQTLRGHTGFVYSVAFSQDSSQLASASSDLTLKLWKVSSGKCLQTFKGHSSHISSVAFSHESTRLASASYDNTVKIWDARSTCLETREDHSDSVHAVAFSPDSAWLASASTDCTAKIWDVSSGVCLQTLKGHKRCISSVVFSHNSTQVASASHDCTVKIWNASSGKCLQTLEGHNNRVTSVVFSHNSSQLASTSEDFTVKIWKVSSGKCLHTLYWDSVYIRSTAFSHDSTQLAIAYSNGIVMIWNTANGKRLHMLMGHKAGINSIVFSHNSTKLASASDDCTVKIWNASSGVCLQTLKGHENCTSSVAFSQDSSQLASASTDLTVKIWSASSGACLQTLKVDTVFTSLSFDNTGLYLHTEYGTLTLDTPTTTEPQTASYQGLAVRRDRTWITHDSKNLVWLPSEYRPICIAVSGKTIVFGIRAGRVWMCTSLA